MSTYGWFEPVEQLLLDEIDLSDLDFWQRDYRVREGAFHTLRRERPVARFPIPEWLRTEESEQGTYYAVMRYEDVLRASRDPETFISGKGAVSVIDLPEEFLEFFGSLINTDDPRHAHLRRVVLRAFTPRRIERLDAEIGLVAHRLVEQARDLEHFDFVSAIAAPLPLRIIGEIMGIPPEADQFVLERSQRILGALDPEFVPPEFTPDESILTAALELTEFMGELAHTDHPDDTVIGALLSADVDGVALSPSELASFFILLLVAGNETTRNALSMGMIALSEFRDVREELIERPSADQLGRAAEEVVRLASPVVWMRRTLARPSMLSGVPLEIGDRVLLMYPSANRDETVFREPYRFLLDRDNTRHLGFGGYGPHHCLGAHLARAEIVAVLREMLTLMPNHSVAGVPEMLVSNFIAGIKRLPLDAGC
ncbi:cytochrome P450 [Ferrimicrobium sp.]|uniref:cytochrome P450 n=1 Tax=Ferrimicrobium sp. TaxID=2926050 RepID=UPI002635D495|nr:cytochrome P450 [Ferrimicrobium sp.]